MPAYRSTVPIPTSQVLLARRSDLLLSPNTLQPDTPKHPVHPAHGILIFLYLEAAKAYYGWISPKMIQRYYHADVAALKAVAAAIDGARATAETQVLHNQHVIDMLAGGLEAGIVIETVRASFCSFDVSPQTLMQMNDSGVPAAVIKEMIKASRKPASAGINHSTVQVANRHTNKRA